MARPCRSNELPVLQMGHQRQNAQHSVSALVPRPRRAAAADLLAASAADRLADDDDDRLADDDDDRLDPSAC